MSTCQNAPEGDLPRRVGAGLVWQLLQFPLTWFGCAVLFIPRRAPAPTLTLCHDIVIFRDSALLRVPWVTRHTETKGDTVGLNRLAQSGELGDTTFGQAT